MTHLCIVGWPLPRSGNGKVCEGELQEVEEVPSGARYFECKRCGARYAPAALKRLPAWAGGGQ